MPKKCRPIGFFDSGVGGISVLKTAYTLMPNENYIYYGDSANAPYGNKTESQIKELSLSSGSFLHSKGVKAIVMACNTATSAAVKMMREKYNIPVISMEPAVRPALGAAKSGKVLVLATPATVTQSRYLSLLERLDAGARVVNVGCGGLVELIENGQTDEKSVHAYLARKLEGLKDIDTAVLGCTHYAFVEDEIKTYLQSAFGKQIEMFDGRHGTARQLKRVIEERDIACRSDEPGSVSFYTSGHESLIPIYGELFNKFNR